MSSSFPALMSLVPGARVLVAGGTGTVGSGVTLAAVKQGAQVIVVTRCSEKFEALLNSIPEQYRSYLSAVVGDLKTEKGAERVFSEATALPGGIQHVVASLQGGKTWWRMGRLMDQSLKDFKGITPTEATPHFLLMKAFLPYLAPKTSTTYTVVTGYPGSGDTAPCTPSSLLCVATGTVHGLVKGAKAEYHQTKVAINEVHLKCLVQRNPDVEVASLGPHIVGNDLAGAAVTGVMVSSRGGSVVISNRASAKEWVVPNQCFPTRNPPREVRPPVPTVYRKYEIS